MSVSDDQQTDFGFDGYRVDLVGRRLWKDGKLVAITSKMFDLLYFLVKNQGRTLTKEELTKNVWAGTFVDEGNLNKTVSMLRKALGDELREQRYIRTIPKVGYRFTAEVTEIPSNGSAATGRKSTYQIPSVNSPRSRRAGNLVVALMGVAIAVLGAFIYFGNFFGVEDKRSSRNKEAQFAYEKGRRLWQNRTPAGLHEATMLLQTAVRIDPEFALAHSALADAYAFDYQNWRMAEATARKAIELDQHLGEPHATLGFVRMFWEWDLASAGAELNEAIFLNPRYPEARQWYALYLAATGHVDGALVENGKALELAPESLAIRKDRCQLLYFAGRYSEAEALCESLLASNNDLNELREQLYRIYMSSGQYEKSVAMFAEFLTSSKDGSLQRETDQLLTEFRNGGIDRFRAAQANFHRGVDRNYYRLARLLAESGDLDRAESALKDAIQGRNFELIFYTSDPAFYSLRNEAGRKPISELSAVKWK